VTSFELAHFEPSAYDPKTYLNLGCTQEEAEAQAKYFSSITAWRNDEYQVFVRDVGDYLWLSIKRNDKKPIGDWRIKQQIKNMIAGEESEAVELYPAESRLVDTSNQYHLYVLKDKKKFPFGFRDRLVGSPEEAAKFGAVQRAMGAPL
jgi:hypothetical protein